MPSLQDVGIVAIGRNEGERLRRCLASLVPHGVPIAYVDSGSTDGSQELAREAGARVVDLDTSTPFTAARGRNAGARELGQLDPRPRFLQFLDGDCELDPAWLQRAVAVLDSEPDVAVVCGRRRERFPDASVYNRLCDLEWDTPIGDAEACGGDALMRFDVFDRVGGFNPELISGEEPELCLRIRQLGHRVRRIDAEMTLHDAALTRFSQWWKRAVRAGHAIATGIHMYGPRGARGYFRTALSIGFWVVVLPVACAVGAVVAARSGAGGIALGCALALPVVYSIQVARIAAGRRRHGDAWSSALVYGGFCMLGKAAELVGMLRFGWDALRGRKPRLIEYKGVTEPSQR